MVGIEPQRWHVTSSGIAYLEHAVALPSSKHFRRRALEILWAGSKSNYWENAVKNLILGAAAFSAPSPVFFGLWTSALTDASHGGTAGEVTGGSYDRVSKTNNTTNFATVGDNVAKVNSNDIQFPAASANWGTITYTGCFDGNAKTSGDNLLLWADLTASRVVNNGDTAKFATGDFSYTVD